MVHVVKVGGSLLDLPDLVARLRDFREREMGTQALLVVGGGAAADAVRRLDAQCALGATRGHWLAVRAMQFHAHLLLAGMERASLVGRADACEAVWQSGELAVMEPMDWLRYEEEHGEAMPHDWQFTSDSIAAHAAKRLRADRLTLLKSTLPCESDGRAMQRCTLAQATEQGVVDRCFAQAAAGLACVELVNLRAAGWARCGVVRAESLK